MSAGIALRPTEVASTTEFVPSAVAPHPVVYAVTVYPPLRQSDTHVDGGFVTLAVLHADCWDNHSWRARLRRAWRAWRGCPDTEVYWDTAEDVLATVEALTRARVRAFQDEA
jgi:hypothetical protein